MLKRKQSSPGEEPSLENVRSLWLKVSDSDKYLLLEDTDTGDIHMPLIQMRNVFEANYSRKLSSLKNRLVSHGDEAAEGAEHPPQGSFFYWRWAFESPHEVKVLIRKMLGDNNTPNGHLRLVLLPIVYNALCQKEELRASPLFRKLHGVIKQSSYYQLLKHPPPEVDMAITSELGHAVPQLFAGPTDFAQTQEKYMSSYSEAVSGVPSSAGGTGGKKAKASESPLIETASRVEANTTTNFSLERMWQSQQSFQADVKMTMDHLLREISTLNHAVQVLTHHIGGISAAAVPQLQATSQSQARPPISFLPPGAVALTQAQAQQLRLQDGLLGLSQQGGLVSLDGISVSHPAAPPASEAATMPFSAGHEGGALALTLGLQDASSASLANAQQQHHLGGRYTGHKPAGYFAGGAQGLPNLNGPYGSHLMQRTDPNKVDK